MISCHRCGTRFAVAPWNAAPIPYPPALPAHPRCPPPDREPHPGLVLAPHLGWLPEPVYGTPESLVALLAGQVADRNAATVPVRTGTAVHVPASTGAAEDRRIRSLIDRL